MAVRAHEQDDLERQLHTRAICFHTVMPWLKEEQRQTLQEFWPHPWDKVQKIDEEQTANYMKFVTEAYARGEGTYSYEEWLEQAKKHN